MFILYINCIIKTQKQITVGKMLNTIICRSHKKHIEKKHFIQIYNNYIIGKK